MKLLAVNNVFPPGFIGGYELGAFDLLMSMSARGHQVCVLTSDYLDGEGEPSPFDVRRTLDWLTLRHDRWPIAHTVELSAYVNPANVRRLAATITEYKPDVIMLFNIMGLGALGMAQFVDRCGIPFVLYLMDNVFVSVEAESVLLKNYRSLFGELRYESAPVTVVMSENLASEVRAIPGLLGEDVRVIPGWIDATSFPEVAVREGREARFVFCSRVTGHKGIGVLESAVEMTVRRGTTDFIVDVYGQGEVPQFIQSVKSRGLERWLRYCGTLNKDVMTRRLAEYDGLLLPTWKREPFGFVVSEAAAAGCIPVMTAGIGASEWFVDGVDCLKIDRDQESLHLAMRRIVAMPPVQRQAMRAAAQSTAKRVLMFDRWADKVHNICVELANRPSRSAPNPASVEAAFSVLADLWLHAPA